MKKQKYINIILGFLTTFALLLNYTKIYKKGLKAITNIFIVSPIISSIILIALIFFYSYFNKKEFKINWLQKITSIFFALIMIFGKSYEELNTWDLIFKNKLTILISIIAFIGYYVLFSVIFKFLNNVISKINIENTKTENKNKIIKLFEEKPFITSILTILVFWLIYLIAFYPGILTPDASYQILQAFNIHTKYSDYIIQIDPNVNITNHHPVLHTILLGICVKIGQALLNDNLGIFIYTLVQTLILASSLAYTIKYLKKINISYKIRLILLAIYSLVPMFPFYAVTDVKDTIYTALIIIYVIKLYDFITFYKENKVTVKQIVSWVILSILISLVRNNGIYVVLISLLFTIFYTKLNAKKMAIIFLVIILLYQSYNKIILPYFKISNTSIREALSIPFQQTARYVKNYEGELTQHEKEVIDNILVYDKLARKI